ncbi:MAG: hypothetical protein ACJ77K_16295 [Bacteroidia bacterium]
MIKSMKYLVAALFTVLFAAHSSAQHQLDTLHGVGVGSYKPVIVDAPKLFETPVVVDSTKKLNVKGYGINSKKVATGYNVEPVEAAEMVGEPLTKLYNGLVKIGMGNYKMPYGEAWYNNLRSREYSAGFRIKHLSSSSTLADYGFAGFSDNEASIYGKKFLKEHTLSGNFDYTRNVVHAYGYHDSVANFVDRDAMTVQRFNYFGAGAELKSHYTKKERYNHDIRMNYYYLYDTYKSSENNFRVNGYVQTEVMKELLKVNGSVDYYNFKTPADTTNNTIITLNPNFIADGEKYKASIGVTAAVDVFVKSKFYFYPNIDLSYNIFDNIIVPYAGATGGIQKNSLKTITDDNPFVNTAFSPLNTNKKYELYGGLKGTLSSTIAYNAKVSYSSLQNVVLYVNSGDLLSNRFDVIYDDAELLNISGQVSYQQREKLRIGLSGSYSNYKMKLESRAWYKPQLEFSLFANYNLRDKIVAKVDLFYLGNQYVKTYENDPTAVSGKKVVPVELKGTLDANLGLEYRYTKKLGFFLNFTNIANYRYYRYSNYPTHRFGFMGGLSYSF